jgi:SNARE protein
LVSEIDNIRSMLQTVPNKRDEIEKQSLLDKAERKLRSANGTKRSYKMECRLLNDPNEKQRFERQLSQHEHDLAELTDEVGQLRNELQRGVLFTGAQSNGSPEEDGDAMLAEAANLQGKTQHSLDNTKRMVAESKEVGTETMTELQRQREQITRIDETATKMGNDLDRAEKLIKTFGRRMATDRFIQCFACVNVFLLVGVIVYIVVMKNKFPDANPLDPLAPTNPVRRGLMIALRGAAATTDTSENVLSGGI